MAISARRKQPRGCELKKKRLEEYERMELTGVDRDAFLEAVLNPPKPTEKLVAIGSIVWMTFRPTARAIAPVRVRR